MPVQEIARIIRVDYAHCLPNHFSFCNQIHGHCAKVVAVVRGEVIRKSGSSSQGMVLDFKFLKALLIEEVHNVLDHGFAVWKEDTKLVHAPMPLLSSSSDTFPEGVSVLDFVTRRNTRVLLCDEPPTAEYLARWAFEKIERKIVILANGIRLIRVEWHETENNYAVYDKSFQSDVSSAW